MDSDICTYCGQPALTGSEAPEHILPAAINARKTTRAVCTPCNRWAGQHVDQPWLNDAFVGHTRFVHKIPDRRGRVLEFDPLLAGATADGTQLRIGHDKKPIALNSPVIRDDEAGTVEIRAKDQKDLDRLVERERKRAEAAGKSFSFDPDAAKEVSHQPEVQIAMKVVPGQWERMAVKATLAFLAETQPPHWRTTVGARALRERLRAPHPPANEVALGSGEEVAAFASEPASAIVVMTTGDGAAALVSLMGRFSIYLPLESDLIGIDAAWVSDPLEPEHSVCGRLGEVVATRDGFQE